MMSSSNHSKIGKANPKQVIEEPKSAHATPVVEKYIQKRNIKADKQIKHEEHGNSHAE